MAHGKMKNLFNREIAAPEKDHERMRLKSTPHERTITSNNKRQLAIDMRCQRALKRFSLNSEEFPEANKNNVPIKYCVKK